MATTTTTTFSVRLNEELSNRLEFLAKLAATDRGSVIRQLIARSEIVTVAIAEDKPKERETPWKEQ